MMTYCPTTFADYLKEQKQVLKDLHIWRKLSAEEQMNFRSCTTEIQVDNKMRGFIRKYL